MADARERAAKPASKRKRFRDPQTEEESFQNVKGPVGLRIFLGLKQEREQSWRIGVQHVWIRHV